MLHHDSIDHSGIKQFHRDVDVIDRTASSEIAAIAGEKRSATATATRERDINEQLLQADVATRERERLIDSSEAKQFIDTVFTETALAIDAYARGETQYSKLLSSEETKDVRDGLLKIRKRTVATQGPAWKNLGIYVQESYRSDAWGSVQTIVDPESPSPKAESEVPSDYVIKFEQGADWVEDEIRKFMSHYGYKETKYKNLMPHEPEYLAYGPGIAFALDDGIEAVATQE